MKRTILIIYSGELTCNSDCHCDYVKYSPVCGSDGQTYISPCHAGCKGLEQDGKKKVSDQNNYLRNLTTLFQNNLFISDIH